MRPGARTPEELETLLEDAFVIRDRAALAGLFDAGAVLVAHRGTMRARGGQEIARLVTAAWDRDLAYVAAPGRVLQARDVALIVAEHDINVVRRGSDRLWRYAISLLNLDPIDP